MHRYGCRTMRVPRTLRLLAALMLGLLFLMAAQPRIAHAEGLDIYTVAFNNVDSIGTSHPAWMSWLPDSESLGLISIPGTHDTMAIHGGQAAQAQASALCGAASNVAGNTTPCDVTAQLNAGIRFLDIRNVCQSGDPANAAGLPAPTGAFTTTLHTHFEIYHGSVDQDAEFGHDVLAPIAGFLQAHPSETVLMNVDDSGDSCSGMDAPYQTPFEERFAQYEAAFPGLFWTPTCPGLPSGCQTADDVPPPTLGAVRGHIVAVQNFTAKAVYGLAPYITDEGAHYSAQNQYVVCAVVAPPDCGTDLNGKAQLVKDELARSTAGDGTKMYYNFLSGSTGASPVQVAGGLEAGLDETGVNQQVLQYLFADPNNGYKPAPITNTGVMAMDFAGAGLIDAIIAHNLPNATSVQGPEADYQQIVQSLAYAAGDYGDSYSGTTVGQGHADARAVTLDQFFSLVAAPGQHVHVVVSNSDASSTTYKYDGLEGDAHGVGSPWLSNQGTSYFNLVFTTLSNRSALTSADVQAVADPVIAGFTSDQDQYARSSAIYDALVATYPGQLWTVTVHNNPAGLDNWSNVQQGVTYNPRPGDGHGYDISGVRAGVAAAVSSSSSAATYGQAVTFNAQVTSAAGVPAGAVSFYDGNPASGGVLIGSPQTPDSSGRVSVTTSSLGAGAHTIYAVYTSADGSVASQGTLAQQIASASLTITAGSPSMTYGDAVPVITPGYSGFVNGEGTGALTSQPACSAAATSASGVGTYATTCSGAADPNYAISYAPGRLTVNRATLTVTADDKGMTYGGAVPALTYSYGGFKNGDTSSTVSGAPMCATTATSGSPSGGGSAAGRYPITCTAGSLAAANYTFASQPGTLTVSPAPLTIAAGSASMTYGDAVPAIAPSYRGFVNGDTVGSLTSKPTCGTAATSASPVAGSPYATSCSGAASPNYTIGYTPGTLTVTKAPLTVTAADATKVYGDPNPAFTGTLTGVKNNDAIAATYSSTATATTPAGTYAIVPALPDPTGKLGNYAVTATNGTLTITRRPTRLAYTGATLLAQGQTVALSATLSAGGAAPLSGLTVHLTLGSGSSAQSCDGVTDSNGVAACRVTVNQPLGPQPLGASFAGDANNLPSAVSAQGLVYANLSSGAFVLGDQTAASALASGATVTYWGAQWAAQNSLSGGSAPSSFKGFAASLGATPAAAGGSWTSGPGDSAGAPTSVPAYMAVVVASRVTKFDGTIAGDVARVAIVKTTGTAGTGTVVAQLP